MNKTVPKNEENSKNREEKQRDLSLEKAKNRSKLLRFLIFLKDIFYKMALFIFMYFARRLEFALHGFLTFNPIIIGLICLEWWFYFDGFWQYIIPFFVDRFFPTLIKSLELKLGEII